MIDIHAHILPAVDDGAQNEVETLAMLQTAVNEGIRTIVATPHYNRNFTQNRTSVLRKVELLQKMIAKHQLDVAVLPGQEIRIYGEVLEDIQSGKLLTIADHSQHVLIEFPFRSVPHYAERLFFELEDAGITPIIAHPERNLELQENPGRLYDFVVNGALTQVTTSSLTGYFGKQVQKFSRDMIEHNLAHVLATDAHNNSDRSFTMSEAFADVEKRFGTYTMNVLQENARLIIEGEDVLVDELPQMMSGNGSKKKFFGLF
ncbi:MAG: hypothetical protein FWE07_02055 [Turicibacter sp.]|nr:hypothetical protein [Turicibacter sp.]